MKNIGQHSNMKHDTVACIVGGNWSNSSNAGPFACNLNNNRTSSYFIVLYKCLNDIILNIQVKKRLIKMMYQTQIDFRGKLKKISDLKNNSTKKIKIVCPCCGAFYERYFRILANSGNFLCQKCSIKESIGTRPKVGFKINKLTLVEHTDRYTHSKYLCDCGNTKILENIRVQSSHVKSCGCLKKDAMLYAKSKQDFNGENHPNWQGGISEENNLLRTSKRYKNWRTKVFERDGYICQKCSQIGGDLNAHHINEFANNKEKIYEVSNGITFCSVCHRKFHSIYGQQNLTQKDLEEFIK